MILSVVPKGLVVVDLNHACTGEFFHFDLGPRRRIPGGRIVLVLFLEFPNEIRGLLSLLPADRIFDHDVSVLDPEGPVLFTQYPQRFSV